MTDKIKYPETLFLPPEAFEGYSKYLNIYGQNHVCHGEPHVEYVRADLVVTREEMEAAVKKARDGAEALAEDMATYKDMM